MIDTPSTWRKPAAKMKSHTSGLDQGGYEALPLVNEAQRLPPDDAAEADQVLAEGEAVAFPLFDDRGHASAPAAVSAACVSRPKASRISAACAPAVKDCTAPCARIRPLCSTTTWSCGPTSSIRWVAPEHPDPLGCNELADVFEDFGTRPDVETGGRLVEQKQPWAMQQRAGDLNAPYLADRQIADPVAALVAQGHARQHPVDLFVGAAAADAVQRGMVQQVLAHRQVGVERLGLEHDAELLQRGTRLAADVMAEDPDMPEPAGVKARDQGK